MASSQYQLKVLSGAIHGIEFTLYEGDTVFRVGAQSEMMDGHTPELLAGADNAYFIPHDGVSGTFVLRVAAEADATRLQRGECDAEGRWQFEALAENQPVRVLGMVFIAVRIQDQDWSAAVLSFDGAAIPDSSLIPAHASPTRATSKRVWWWLAAGMMVAALATGVYWMMTRPEVQVRALEQVLEGAPATYQVVYGSDQRLYAFTDSAQGVVWGQRAARRLDRDTASFLQRSAEAERVTKLLVDVGRSPAVVRLREPARPTVVFPVLPAARSLDRIKTTLMAAMPYAKDVRIEQASDEALAALAQGQLQALGIATRVERSNGRVNVVNAAFMDDVGLHAMRTFAADFKREWGGERVTISIRLWDDLLQGRSYQYSPGQLLSVGDGRWEFSTSAQSRSN